MCHIHSSIPCVWGLGFSKLQFSLSAEFPLRSASRGGGGEKRLNSIPLASASSQCCCCEVAFHPDGDSLNQGLAFPPHSKPPPSSSLRSPSENRQGSLLGGLTPSLGIPVPETSELGCSHLFPAPGIVAASCRSHLCAKSVCSSLLFEKDQHLLSQFPLLFSLC